MSKETKELATKQYMVLAKIKGDAGEILRLADGSFEILAKGIKSDQLVTDRMFDLMLSFSNSIGEIIKEYLASKSTEIV